jgi:hypothetical protein
MFDRIRTNSGLLRESDGADMQQATRRPGREGAPLRSLFHLGLPASTPPRANDRRRLRRRPHADPAGVAE